MTVDLRRSFVAATILLGLTLISGCAKPPRVEHGPQPTIIFIVLDTVRSDHLSLCGYERPTSPRLERLAAQAGAVSTCRAYAPGDWTLPSHASFFTGRAVTEHGARMSLQGPVLATITVTPLAPSYSTLAEQLVERGYQTVAVSANPVVAPEAGLMQGFQTWRAADKFGALSGRSLVDKVQEALEELNGKRGGPLFLFVNIADAHGPWQKIPNSIEWLPRRGRLQLALGRAVSPYRRYVLGELDETRLAEARAHYRDAYDYGVYRADRTLGQLLRMLDKSGWLSGHHRIVVTSDHGEFVAERGLVGHGGHLFEANNRIPLVYLDSEHPAASLTEPLSGLAPFYLARDGRFPATEPPVAVAFPQLRMLRVFGALDRWDETSVGLWEDHLKWLWVDGELQRFDLRTDPGETDPEVLPLDQAPERLDQAIADLAILSSRAPQSNEALLDKLRALGYVD